MYVTAFSAQRGIYREKMFEKMGKKKKKENERNHTRISLIGSSHVYKPEGGQFIT